MSDTNQTSEGRRNTAVVIAILVALTTILTATNLFLIYSLTVRDLPKSVVVCNNKVVNVHTSSFSVDVSTYHKIWINYKTIAGPETVWTVWFQLPYVSDTGDFNLDIPSEHVLSFSVKELDVQGPTLHFNLIGTGGGAGLSSETPTISIILYLT